MTRTPLVAANWKMNGDTAFVREFTGLWRDIEGIEQVFFPPAPYLGLCVQGLSAAGSCAGVGAQDVHTEVSGAYTGDMAAEMVRDLGGGWTLVGHSERRQYHGETDELLAAKIRAARRAGIRPVLCVGESLEERDAGRAESVVARQLRAVFTDIGAQLWGDLVVAYEPIWAIGTGRSATATQAQQMHAHIRGVLSELGAGAGNGQVLYGGSVNDGNAAELFAQPDIDGALVGGASLKVDSFSAIARALAQASA